VSKIGDGFVFERHLLTRSELYSMIGVEGFKESAIREILKMYPSGYKIYLQDDTKRDLAQNKDTAMSSISTTLDALEFWGTVSGSILKQWGMVNIEDDEKEYKVNAWKIGHIVFKSVLNEDTAELHPYSMVSYEPIPDSVWGLSLYLTMRDSMEVINSSARGVMTNIPFSSQPLASVNVDMLAEGETSGITPGKTYKVTSDQMRQNTDPVRFFAPPSVSSELLNVMEAGQELASEASGIPRLGHGGEQAGTGAATTASGLAMIRNDTGRQIKDLILDIETKIISPRLNALYVYNMIYSDDESIKGDATVVMESISSLMSKEVRTMRLREALDSTNNPVDTQILGLEGRAEMLKEFFGSLEATKNIADIIEQRKVDGFGVPAPAAGAVPPEQAAPPPAAQAVQ
jgi:hypothetical protein